MSDAKEVSMRINLPNLLKQVAKSLRRADGSSPWGYSFVLTELRNNLIELARDPAQWNTFADMYCIDAELPIEEPS